MEDAVHLNYWRIWDSIMNLASDHNLWGKYTQAEAIAMLEDRLQQLIECLPDDVE